MKEQRPMQDVVVVIGAGQIGQAIARRVGFGKQILLADQRLESAAAAAEVLANAGYQVSVAAVDVASHDAVHGLVQTATGLGEVTGLIHAAGVSPSQASPETILRVDLYGTALALEAFGNVIVPGGSGVVIASQSGHRLPPLSVEQNKALATTSVEALLKLPFLQPDQVTDPLNAYQLSKRGNSLRVMAEAVRWGQRGARLNTISPGIIMTPLARDELSGPRGDGYRKMIETSAAGRAGTPDEVATVAALLMGRDGGFITGSDVLMDAASPRSTGTGISRRASGHALSRASKACLRSPLRQASTACSWRVSDAGAGAAPHASNAFRRSGSGPLNAPAGRRKYAMQMHLPPSRWVQRRV
jgi:NAD(P)-dependent dehydrogenase (short-subunit alcohol dehydrogenase family)